MELNEIIKKALIKIDFVKRYEKLSETFDSARTPESEMLEHIDGEEIMEMIQALGYNPGFDSRGKFFKIKQEKSGVYTFGFNIILRYGVAELVWVVKRGKEVLLGSPWGTYSERLIDKDYKILSPIFGTYEDLEEIFKTAFEMYEDFKKAVILSKAEK